MYKPKKNEVLFIDPIVQFDKEVPERRLYWAIILQALLDATNKTNILIKNEIFKIPREEDL